MGLFVSGVQEKLVDKLTLLNRQSRVIANNIANTNVPSYTAKRIDFSKVLRKEQMRLELSRTNPRHRSGLKESKSLNDVPVRDTFQPVELDEEIVRMTKTSMEYQAMLQILKSRFDLFSRIISGRVE